MTREDVEGTIKCMAKKYSKLPFVFKNTVVLVSRGYRIVFRFYKDAFTITYKTKTEHERNNIAYKDVNACIRFFSRLLLDCNDCIHMIQF